MAPYSGDPGYSNGPFSGATTIVSCVWPNAISHKEHALDFQHDYRNRSKLINGMMFILRLHVFGHVG